MVLKKKKQTKKTTIDDLAMMIGRGFNETGERIETLREENALEHGKMKRENTLEHDEMKTRLDNVAYRFELVELQKRVEILERRISA